MVKTLTTSSGVDFIVDDEDFEIVSKHKWKCDKTGYIRRNVWFDKKSRCEAITLHRYLLNAPEGMLVDHINGIITDNRKCNLRLASKSENRWNSKPPINNKSGYKGVSLSNETGKWRAQITVNGKRVNLGHFDNKHDAARMYNFWARDIFGDYAWLNKIREGDEVESCDYN
jgi:hypothetical protein